MLLSSIYYKFPHSLLTCSHGNYFSLPSPLILPWVCPFCLLHSTICNPASTWVKPHHCPVLASSLQEPCCAKENTYWCECHSQPEKKCMLENKRVWKRKKGEGGITLAKCLLSMRRKTIVNLKEIPAFQIKFDLIAYREKEKMVRVRPVTLKHKGPQRACSL